MLTSKHFYNYWCRSLRYQLGNLLCEVISSTWKRRKKPPFAGLPILVSIVCQGKDNTGTVNKGWREGAPRAKGILASHFIAWILILDLQLHPGTVVTFIHFHCVENLYKFKSSHLLVFVEPISRLKSLPLSIRSSSSTNIPYQRLISNTSLSCRHVAN